MTDRRLAVIAIAVIIGGLAACTKVAFKELWLNKREPVQFGCAMPLDSPQTTVQAKIVFGTVSDRRTHPQFATKVGRQWWGAFDPRTEPIVVFEADLRRALTAIGVEFMADSQVSEGGIRLDGNLLEAHSELPRNPVIIGPIKVTGRFVFTIGLVRREDKKILWTTNIDGEYVLERPYVLTQDVGEALSGAYCEALRKLVRINESKSFRKALLDQ